MILNYVRIRNIMLLCESLCRNHMNFHELPVHLDMDFCCVKKGLKLYISNPSFDFAALLRRKPLSGGAKDGGGGGGGGKGARRRFGLGGRRRKKTCVGIQCAY